MVAILYGIYAFTFWGSEVPLRWFDFFFEVLGGAASLVIPEGNLQSLIVSGIIDGVGGVLGFVPLIMFMFFAIAIMEDSGYMARVAYMLDRVLRLFGLHGNSVMSLIVSGGISGGCAVPGAMATRTLRDPKERIATLLVLPFMNCGAKLPLYAVLIGAFFPRHEAMMMFILTLFSWAFALLAAKLIRSTVLKGPKTPFVMELPPYRLPTFRGLLIHTWERTWEYIKKAGTVILVFSIILWAMMTYPGLSKEQSRSFEDHRNSLTESFLVSPDVRQLLKGQQGLADFSRFYDAYSRAVKDKDNMALEQIRKSPFFPLIHTVSFLEAGKIPDGGFDTVNLRASELYLRWIGNIKRVDIQEHQAALKNTIAGWLGQYAENITRPLGFDYRVNIALLGGIAAKEVIVSTLGTAYSLGEVSSGEKSSLSARLKNDPDWNPLMAFTLIIFTMLYVPCFVTVISIRRESSWRWAGFSIAFNLVVAYFVALVVSQAGKALGIGG